MKIEVLEDNVPVLMRARWCEVIVVGTAIMGVLAMLIVMVIMMVIVFVGMGHDLHQIGDSQGWHDHGERSGRFQDRGVVHDRDKFSLFCQAVNYVRFPLSRLAHGVASPELLPTAASRATGNRNENVVPRPGWLAATFNVPP